MQSGNGLQFTVLVGEQPIDVFSVYEFEAREALSDVFSLTITAFSHRSSIGASEFLEQEAELRVYLDGELLRQFRGVVAEFGRGSAGHRRTCYYLTIRSPLWRLGLGRNSRISQHQTPEQIIRTLLEERGVSGARFSLLRTPEEREYCVQYRESDLAFIQRLAAEEGWHYRAEHGSDGTELILSDHHREALALPPALYNVTAGGSSRQPCVFAFDTLDRVSVAGVAMKDYTFTNPAYGLDHTEVASDLSKQRPDYEHFDYPGRYKQDASGAPFTKARLEALRSNACTANGKSNRPDFTAGGRFGLEGHFDDAVNARSEEHTSELQSRPHLVCRLLLEKKNQR